MCERPRVFHVNPEVGSLSAVVLENDGGVQRDFLLVVGTRDVQGQVTAAGDRKWLQIPETGQVTFAEYAAGGKKDATVNMSVICYCAKSLVSHIYIYTFLSFIF